MELRDEEIVEMFFQVITLNRKFSANHYGNKSFFQGQCSCLLVLENVESINQKDLASLLHVRPTSVSEILVKLEQKGLIKRMPSEKDRRITLVSLTEAGYDESQNVRRSRAMAHREMVVDLTEDEKAHLYTALQKIKAHYLSLEEADEQ